jgi:hypothetical protein
LVIDEGTSRGPLPVDQVRRALASGEIGPGARFRVAEEHPWLPGAAWEALADLLPSPHTPGPPEAEPAALLPGEIAEVPPRIREHLLWFVADQDGVMGPLGGNFIVKGIRAGKISLSAAVSLASWRVKAAWVRAQVAFPSASAGSTTMRKAPTPEAPCASCLEPLPPGAATCPACGEPARVHEPTGGRALALLGALLVAAVLAAAGIVLARRVYGPAVVAPGPTAATASASAAPSAGPAGSAASSAAEGAPRASPGRLSAAQIAATLTVPKDAADVLALSERRLAVARDGALAIVDAESGDAVLSAPEIAGARALRAVHGAGVVLAALGEGWIGGGGVVPAARPASTAAGVPPAEEEGQGRLAILDPRTARVLAWIHVRAVPLAGLAAATERGLVLLAEPERQAVAVLDAARLVEVARVPLGAPVGLVAVDDRGAVALAGEGAPAEARPGGAAAGGALLAFAPVPAALLGAALRPWRRIQLPEHPAAVAISGDGAFGAAILRGRGEIARVDLAPGAALGLPGPRARTCAGAARLAIGAGAILVACEDSRAVALHDSATLALIATIELGGPALDLDLSPDRAQALLAVGPPASGVAVVDIGRRQAATLAAGEPVEAVRYGVGGRVATAFAPTPRKVVVLR